MIFPLKRSIVLKVGDEGTIKDLYYFPCGILKLCIFQLYKDLLDSAMEETMLSFVKNDLKLVPNGTFFIHFGKASLNTTMKSNNFI
jgi:hypothetical protein